MCDYKKKYSKYKTKYLNLKYGGSTDKPILSYNYNKDKLLKIKYNIETLYVLIMKILVQMHICYKIL